MAGVAHTTTVKTTPARGLPVETIDANGRVTRQEYDALGRLSTVRLPGTEPSEHPDYRYTYNVSQTGDSFITARRLQRMNGSRPIYRFDYTYVDGMGRTVETQVDSPSGPGRVVTQTRYDRNRREAATTVPMFMSGEAGTGLANPQVSAIPSETRITYDSLDRIIETALWATNTKKWGTTTTWSADQSTVTPPTGKPTTTHVDARGQVTSVVETLDSGSATTRYEYDLAGNLIRTTDAKGNVTSYTYDWLGRLLSVSDPDAGTTTSAYDANGNVTRTTDARGTVLVSVYDELDRRTELRKDSTSGPLLAEWRYDPTGFKGMLDRSIRHTADGDYVVSHTYESTRGRLASTTWTIPAAEGALAGSYTQSFTYDDADRLATVTYPEAGGLPAETVTQSYSALGLPTTMQSPLGTYVGATTYAADGTLVGRQLGSDSATYRVSRSYTYDTASRRLTKLQAVLAGTGTVLQDDSYTYDNSGNVTRITDNSPEGAGQRQCFVYDGRHRLIRAYTAGVDCTAGSEADWSTAPGPARYRQDFIYDEIGNITSRADNGGAAKAYTYPASGPNSVRPHAVTAIGTDTYSYDAAGNMTGRTVEGVSSTYSWGEMQKLVKAVVGGQTTEFVYDAEGNRLVRRTPDGRTTLYVAGMEITNDGKGISASRYYVSGNVAVTVRKSDGSNGKVFWLLGDAQGSVQLTVSADTGDVSRQRYTPFGAHRGATDALGAVTDHGFLGSVEDDSTGLVELGARYYDPTIGRFISTDPLVDMRNPQTMNAYTYAANNPVTWQDPTGLRLCEDRCRTGSILTTGSGEGPRRLPPAPSAAARPTGQAAGSCLKSR